MSTALSPVFTNIIAEVLNCKTGGKNHNKWKQIKGSLFTDDVSAYPENTNESTD